ncbi:MAG TPA: hypothetical protein VFZ40_02935 [Pyrinomonadaceae bacterium]
MVRRITLSIALTLGIVFGSLMSSDSTAQAQPRMRFRADTGVVALGPNQVLRVTVTDSDSDGADFLAVRFRRMQYAQGPCSGGVCKLGSVTDLILDPFGLMAGEAAYIDIPQGGFAAVRGVVQTNRRNVRATATIINTVTGETTTHIIMANTEGDFH